MLGTEGWGGRRRLRPGREVERGRRGQRSSRVPVVPLVQRGPGSPRHFRGWGGVGYPTGSFAGGAYSRRHPRCVLPIWSPGEAGLPGRPRREEAESPPRHKDSPRRGRSRRRGRLRGRKGASPREVGEEAVAAAARPAPWRHRECERVASAEEEEEPSRGAPAQTKITAASRWRVTPLSAGQGLRWRECGKPEEPMGRRKMGTCQGLSSPMQLLFSAFLCPTLVLPNSAG